MTRNEAARVDALVLLNDLPSLYHRNPPMLIVGHAVKTGGSSGDGFEYEIALQPTSVFNSYPQRLDPLPVSLPSV